MLFMLVCGPIYYKGHNMRFSSVLPTPFRPVGLRLFYIASYAKQTGKSTLQELSEFYESVFPF